MVLVVHGNGGGGITGAPEKGTPGAHLAGNNCHTEASSETYHFLDVLIVANRLLFGLGGLDGKPVLEAAVHKAEVLHATSAGCVAPLALGAPVDYGRRGRGWGVQVGHGERRGSDTGRRSYRVI